MIGGRLTGVGGHRGLAAALAVALAIGVGVAIGAASQMAAVNAGDPRGGPIPTLSPTPSPRATASPSASPTPEPTSTVSPEPTGNEVWLYTLADGDSLSGLAIRYGTTTEELLTLNPEYADNQDLVEAGAQVIMPCTPLARAEDLC